MKKFLSRKFIFTAIADITGLITIVMGDNHLSTIIGAVLMLVATIVFCIVEGAIDANSVGLIADSVEDVAGALGANDEVLDAINKVGDIAEDFVDKNGGEDSVEGE